MIKTENLYTLMNTEPSGRMKTELSLDHHQEPEVQQNGDLMPTVALEDRDLWSKFHLHMNEMIVTKTGRRMFPVVRVSIRGLDPSAMYSMLLEFVQIDSHRWKYVNGEWVAGGKPESPPRGATYSHVDSPNFGHHWMKESISFAKVKLTNKNHGNKHMVYTSDNIVFECSKEQIMLNSLHKYEPRLHIIRVGDEHKRVSIHTFPQCRFIAVTAYQNEDITCLKIKYNPFAKAFLDTGERTKMQEAREYMAHQAHQQYGWYMGGGPGMMGGGVSYTQAPPPMGLGSSALTSRLAVNMRNHHRAVPYTSPTPRAARTPPVNGMVQQQANVGPLGLVGLAAEWRQQHWGHHHHPVPPTAAAPASQAAQAAQAAHAQAAQVHYQWAGLQCGYAHHGAGVYQDYEQYGAIGGLGLPDQAVPVATTSSTHTSQRSPHDTLGGEMNAYPNASVNQGFATNRSPPTYNSAQQNMGAVAALAPPDYGLNRLHGDSPENHSDNGSSPHSGSSPQTEGSSTHTQAEMLIMADLSYASGLSAAGVNIPQIKDEAMAGQCETAVMSIRDCSNVNSRLQ